MKIKPFPERFWDKVQKTDGCWLWMGSRREAGYGHSKRNGKVVLAHRTAYELANGPIPPGLCCCHTCDNPPCVNPSHIFLGTQGENMQDRHRKGRDPVQTHTHCKRGHLFTSENSMIRPNGRKTCRICYNAAHRAAWKRNQDKRLAATGQIARTSYGTYPVASLEAHLEAESKNSKHYSP